MSDDLDDLLGSYTSDFKPLQGRKSLGTAAKKTIPVKGKEKIDVMTTAELQQVVTGVPIPFLVQVFGVGRTGVDQALKNVAPVRYGHNGARYYDLKEAASYLVAPKVNLEKFIARMNPDDLPDHLKESYWNAKTKRQTYELKAGDLWHTEKVYEVLSRIFKTIKNRTQLFSETISEEETLSPAQRKALILLLDDLMDQIRKDLKEDAKQNQTFSTVVETDDA